MGILTAFGPFITDMYLPALPSMKIYFSTTVSLVQLGLTASMFGIAAGQLLFGPLSDKYGRKSPLMAAMFLFIISTFACIFSPNIIFFTVLRFFQGIAAAGGVVIARSIAADKFKGKNLTKSLAIVGGINGIAPVIAPVLGGIMLEYTGWKGIFIILLILGIGITLSLTHFDESLSTPRRSKESFFKSLELFKIVFKNKPFILYVTQVSLAMAILFAYISASPFIIQSHYGFSAFAFSLFFAANAVSIGAGAWGAALFKNQDNCLKLSSAGIIISCFMLCIILINNANIIIFEALLLVLCFMLGLTFTSSTAAAMNSARRQAGTASAVLGAMGFLFGSIVSPIVGIGNILFATGITFALLSLILGLFSFLILRQKNKNA